jgi:hypothetical protein
VKKSIAAIASRWFLRKVSQRETVGSDRSKPKLEQLAMNAGRSPGWIFGNHLKD